LFSASEIQREREIAVVSRDSLSAKNGKSPRWPGRLQIL
jgi:hypothetical protein